ncbi:hypothetical protein TNCV_1692521 [Trichonephila clavipes]|nr:hypothetical protein TNCV_1692521 [Trichonephila clavipes]
MFRKRDRLPSYHKHHIIVVLLKSTPNVRSDSLSGFLVVLCYVHSCCNPLAISERVNHKGHWDASEEMMKTMPKSNVPLIKIVERPLTKFLRKRTCHESVHDNDTSRTSLMCSPTVFDKHYGASASSTLLIRSASV